MVSENKLLSAPMNKSTNTKKKVAIAFVCFSILIGFAIWFYVGYLLGGTPEERMWAPIAGFFMGVVIGGILFILSVINLIFVFKK